MSQVRTVAAYLSLHLYEPMPENLSNEEFIEWAMRPEPNEISLVDVRAFLDSTSILLSEIRNGIFNSPSEIMYHFYEAAKRTFDDDTSKIRTYFKWLYLIVFQKEDGPRWGEFVWIYGQQKFVDLMNERFNNLI